MLKIDRCLGIFDAEMPAKFQHNQTILNMHLIQMRPERDFKLGVMILRGVLLERGAENLC